MNCYNTGENQHSRRVFKTLPPFPLTSFPSSSSDAIAVMEDERALSLSRIGRTQAAIAMIGRASVLGNAARPTPPPSPPDPRQPGRQTEEGGKNIMAK